MRSALAALTVATVAGLAAAAGAAGNGGSAGVVHGLLGATERTGKTRYVTLPTGRTTTVAAIETRSGQVVHWSAIRGSFGVPQVAYDGTTEGLTHDGRTLVLAGAMPPPGPGAVSRFAVVSTRSLRARRIVSLRGSFAFDALSPDGRHLYLVEYLRLAPTPRYRVRVADLESGRLLSRRVFDRRLKATVMLGWPVTRTTSEDGVWAYTLYRKAKGLPFVHALDTRGRRAFCIELPWRRAGEAIWRVRMQLADGGRTLRLLHPREPRLGEIDTKALSVVSFNRPGERS